MSDPRAGASFALITGASSGFGVDFARELAARGYDLILVARREANLREVAAEIETSYGRRVETVATDLSSPPERERLVRFVADLGSPLDVLVNNAGFGLFGRFTNIPWEREREMLEVDIGAVVDLCKQLIPAMVERGHGYVLNVASIGAFQPTPLYATYSAAKAFVLSFSQALAFELRGTGVSITVVSPGVAKTEFLAVSKQRATAYQRLAMMSSSEVVRSAVRAMFERRPAVVPGFLNRITAMSTRFAPMSVLARVAHALMKADEPAH